MKKAFWIFVHNCISHPLLGILQWEPRWVVRFHYWSAEKMDMAD